MIIEFPVITPVTVAFNDVPFTVQLLLSTLHVIFLFVAPVGKIVAVNVTVSFWLTVKVGGKLILSTAIVVDEASLSIMFTVKVLFVTLGLLSVIMQFSLEESSSSATVIVTVCVVL